MMKRLLIAALAILILPPSLSDAQDNIHFNPRNTNDYVVAVLNQFVKETIVIDSSLLVYEDPYPENEMASLESWRAWSVVENFSFGKNRGTLSMITDLNALHPFFRDRVAELIRQCKGKGIELAVVESYRTHAKQNGYKIMGRNYTNSAGGRSKHQYGLAVDVVPIVNGKPVWDNVILWKKIGMTGEKLGLRWGGRWKKPYDPGHFEWTGGLNSIHLSAGMLPPIPKEKYPCIEEDIELLRQYWNEWEAIQSASVRK
jgi:hypothetical protein